MALDSRKYEHKFQSVLRDTRPGYIRTAAWLRKRDNSFVIFFMAGMYLYLDEAAMAYGDVILFFSLMFWWWLARQDRTLAFKMPKGAKRKDKNNGRGGKPGASEGILFLGNIKNTREEAWFTNSDARTHILYLGTTGAGKTEGLKSMVANALAWGSGFVYVDGKADTDLWSSLSSLCRRFGRDDDLMVLNYMTGGSAESKAPSNTMNPFSSGSASYLVNMLTSLMPDAEGDNVMWKERAISLVTALMPALVWKRDNLHIPLYVTAIRNSLNLNRIIALSREEGLPDQIKLGVKGYLETLPGYNDAAFDDNGQMKPPGGDVPQVDMNTMANQHGFLTMQLTRSLQSLGEDYGYIFNAPHADVDMVDIVLNRRILVVLIPALEKSGDEIANLGKIIAANMKGMMGSALGATVEGSQAQVIDNKVATSSTPFMTVFDEVGYYTAQGMAVMAAQARSLGFCLVFSGQDLPAMKKRVREEANSITANCNIKIFGKLEDPTETKDFFEKTVGSAFVTEVSGFQIEGANEFRSYFDSKQASVQLRPRASYDGLREFKEGEAVICYSGLVYDTSMFYSNPGHAKAMRVTRYLGLDRPDETTMKFTKQIRDLRDRLVHKTWTARKAAVKVESPAALKALSQGLAMADMQNQTGAMKGILALGNIYAKSNPDAVAAMVHPDLIKASAAVPQVAQADEETGAGAQDGAITPDVQAAPAVPARIIPPLTTPVAPPAVPSAPAVAAPSAAPSQPGGKPAIFGAPKPGATPAAPQVPPSVPPVVATPVTATVAAPPPSFPSNVTPISAAAAPAATKPAIFGAPKPAAPAAPPVAPPPQQPVEAPVQPITAAVPPAPPAVMAPPQEKAPVQSAAPVPVRESATIHTLPVKPGTAVLPQSVDDLLKEAADSARAKLMNKNVTAAE